jgi:hypothetical protein
MMKAIGAKVVWFSAVLSVIEKEIDVLDGNGCD